MSNSLLCAEAEAKLKKERALIPQIKPADIGTKLRGKDAASAKASLMADAVLKVLRDFCWQNEDFAAAVIKGGPFVDCMKAVTNGLGNYAEGLSSCKKAVEFYLPGAEIKMQMSIILPQQAQTETPAAVEEPKSDMVLDLADFF